MPSTGTTTPYVDIDLASPAGTWCKDQFVAVRVWIDEKLALPVHRKEAQEWHDGEGWDESGWVTVGPIYLPLRAATEQELAEAKRVRDAANTARHDRVERARVEVIKAVAAENRVTPEAIEALMADSTDAVRIWRRIAYSLLDR